MSIGGFHTGLADGHARFSLRVRAELPARYANRTRSDRSASFRLTCFRNRKYIAEGHGRCIDLDLEKFFDRVNHDKLMGQIAKRVEDKRLLKLIRAFLNAG